MDIVEQSPQRLMQIQIAEKLSETLIAHEMELAKLDMAIGDGDHGANMNRGAQAILAQRELFGELSLAQACTSIGKELVTQVGGASGALYGTFFLALGKSLAAVSKQQAESLPGENCFHQYECRNFAVAFSVAVEAVKARGKSDVGQKTLLDVLVPVSEYLQAQVATSFSSVQLTAIAKLASLSALSTIPMLAEKGRAAFLGERSIGHLDPGARSSELMITAVVAVLMESTL